jgi:hypothetical protein
MQEEARRRDVVCSQELVGMIMIDAQPAGSDDAHVNALLDEARIPPLVKAAAIALAAAGLTVALLGVQNLTLVRWLGPWILLPLALVAAGALAIAVAAKLVRGRRWTVRAALATAGLLIVGTLGFFVVGVLAGVYSLLCMLGFGGGVAALVLSILAVKPFQRLMATRAQLRDAGFDLDL